MLPTLLPVLALVAAAPNAPMAARADDAAVDQAWLSPTALTQPARTFTAEAHDLVILTVTYAPIDRVQVTVRGAPPLGADRPWVAAATGKGRLLDVDRLHLSLIAGAGLMPGLATKHKSEAFLVAGGVGSVCFDLACRGLASLYALATMVRETDSQDVHNDFFRVSYGASLLVPLWTHVKLVTELNLVGEHRGQDDPRTSTHRLLAGMAGVRFHWGRIAASAGVLAFYSWGQQGVTDSHDEWIVLPALSVGGRFGGS